MTGNNSNIIPKNAAKINAKVTKILKSRNNFKWCQDVAKHYNKNDKNYGNKEKSIWGEKSQKQNLCC